MMTRTFKVIAGTSVAVATNAQTPNIQVIEGYCNGVANTQYFIQLHGVAAPTTGVTVPLRSLQVLGQDGYTFNKTDIGLTTQNLTNPPTQPGLWVFLSSTDGVFTTSGITADINVDVEEWELEFQGTTTVGDTVTGVNYLDVVADPQVPPVNLMQVQVTERNGVASFIQLFALTGDNLVEGQISNYPVIPLPANGTVYLNFGDGGKKMFSQDANGTQHTGISVALSLVAGSWNTQGFGTILATYK